MVPFVELILPKSLDDPLCNQQLAFGRSTPAQTIHKFEHLRCFTLDGERAVHKPLLALLILGRIANGQRAPATFAEIEPKLKELLADFSQPSAVNTPHNPF